MLSEKSVLWWLWQGEPKFGLGRAEGAAPPPSSAATITADDSRDVAVIRIRGELHLGEDDRFLDLALSRRSAIVSFDSPGGNPKAGIERGKFIRLRNDTTVGPNAAVCASACALAWLGGKRIMGARANVGFHAAYMSSGSGHEVTGSSNALVGAYLGQLCFPSPAIVYVTSAAPTKMKSTQGIWVQTASRASLQDAIDIAVAIRTKNPNT